MMGPNHHSRSEYHINYAVEANRLDDRHQFRSRYEAAPRISLVLDSSDRWARPNYDQKSIKLDEKRALSMGY